MNIDDTNKINELMQVSLSGNEMMYYAPKGTNVISYKELVENYKTLDDALGENGILILLYLTTSNNYGHWTAVFKRNNNTIEFFDSYGNKVDDPLKYSDNDVKRYNKQRYPYLIELMLKSKYNIEYNDYKLQSKKKDINTCGRHVLVRITLKDLNINEYYNLLFKKKKYKPDYIVTYITNFIK